MNRRLAKILGRSAWLAISGALAVAAFAAPSTQTQNLILVTIDGLRWQEVYRGAEEALLSKDAGGIAENQLPALRRDFWAPTAEERRRKLMPFFWDVVARNGQAFGNRALGSEASVLNTQWFSYPGYNELLSGRADPLITSNAPIPNRNVTVLEWLHARPGFAGRIAASAEWGVMPAILNVGRSRIPVFAPGQTVTQGIARLGEIEQWMRDIPEIVPGEHFDAFVYQAAIAMFEARRPRGYLLAFGEPDAWAHQRRYDRYLYSIQRCDRFVRQLWEKLQADPEYRGRTSLVLTPDHGRGIQTSDWTSHGAKVPHAGETWLAVLGPDTPPLGERRNVKPVHQAQVAATVAALLGEDFVGANAGAAAAIADVLPRPGSR